MNKNKKKSKLKMMSTLVTISQEQGKFFRKVINTAFVNKNDKKVT